jgi:error-prone DNA polymerase
VTDDAEALVAERDANGPYRGVADLSRRVPLDARELEALLRSGACDLLGEAARPALGARLVIAARRPVQRENKQLTLELDPTAGTPGLRRSESRGSGCSPTIR